MFRALALFVIHLLVTNVSGQLMLNEVCSKNTTGPIDFEGDHEDWVELYYQGTVALDITGFGLSDRNDVIRFLFPTTIINPGDHLVVFLSGKNSTGPELHAPFKLKNTETIYLINSSGTIIDQLQPNALQADHSFGRFPDGNSIAGYTNAPSPGAINPSTSYLGYSAQPVPSHAKGFYPSPISLTLSSVSGSTLYFTQNGNSATLFSPVWTNPYSISTSITLRVIAVQPGYLPSPELCLNYFIGTEHDLPIISITTDSLNLWDYDSGLFVMGPLASSTPPYFGANFWHDTEVPAQIELYEGHELSYEGRVGFSIHGGSMNRSQPMKSIRLTARKKYGEKKMNYSFFPDRPYDEFKQLVLRNGSSDFCKSQMRDELVMNNLLEKTDNDLLATRPCITYINGEYWGLYHLHEKRGKYSLSSQHNVDPDSLDIIRDNILAWEGDTLAFRSMYDFVIANDLTDDVNFNAFGNMIDVKNFTDYYISQIYYGNFDWPFNNIECWRERKPGSKFRYILFDLDVAYSGTPWEDHSYNLWEKINHSYCDSSYHISIFRKSLTNANYRKSFVNRYCDLLNTLFRPENLTDQASQMVRVLEHEIPGHFNRWGISQAIWYDELNQKIFTNCTLRPEIQLNYLKDALQPGEITGITTLIEPALSGSIQLNSIQIDTSTWEGNYFSDVAIHLSPVVKTGSVFQGWKIEKDGSTTIDSHTSISILPTEGVKITAVFASSLSTSPLQLFPNPAVDAITIRLLNSIGKKGDINVIDMNGKQIYSAFINEEEPFNDIQLDLKHIRSGVYTIYVNTGNELFNERFIKL